MTYRHLIFPALGLLLCQCDSLKSDCAALRAREAEIATEQTGDYYIGRRYYIPQTRFWGYVRRPQQSWREAKMVLMDESVVKNPDRGPEEPLPGATFGRDNNVEYILTGKFTGKDGYDPNANLVLPIFRPTSYTVRNEEPGFLFVPSEDYDKNFVTLRPEIMPKPFHCESLEQN